LLQRDAAHDLDEGRPELELEEVRGIGSIRTLEIENWLNGQGLDFGAAAGRVAATASDLTAGGQRPAALVRLTRKRSRRRW
jgi:hypothetical protein